jgi:pyruvate carboxylase
VHEVIGAARRAGADAVYPGYGFLSENPDLAAACAAAGITFVGASAQVLELTGHKARAIAAAREARLPVLASSQPTDDVTVLVAAAEALPFPVFVKAMAGGGGRGMRWVEDPADLPAAALAAMREAESAFGDATVFLEQAVVDPRHIEVQILADGAGNVVHLFERDCSVQCRPRRWSSPRRRRIWTQCCGSGSAPTRSPSPGRSATPARARLSSSSTAPVGMCSSR